MNAEFFIFFSLNNPTVSSKYFTVPDSADVLGSLNLILAPPAALRSNLRSIYNTVFNHGVWFGLYFKNMARQ